MSKEHAKKFVEHVQKDPALRKKVTEASEHIIKVAKDHGYEITREELTTVIKERWSQKKDDEDDAAVAHFSEAPGF
jgi:predicted ribosomally synthesized peptide with nif11-like leader